MLCPHSPPAPPAPGGAQLVAPAFPTGTSRAEGVIVIEKDVGHKTLACLFYVLFISIIAINEITCGSSPQANACNAAVGHTGIAPMTPERPSRDEPSPRPARADTSRFRAGASHAGRVTLLRDLNFGRANPLNVAEGCVASQWQHHLLSLGLLLCQSTVSMGSDPSAPPSHQDC